MPLVNEEQTEFGFINRLRERIAASDRLSIPIGDDAACCEFPEPSRCLVTTDMLMDGVHFRLEETTPQLVGRKALAVNLSDIAAMAGQPLFAFVSVAFPRNATRELTDGITDGLLQLADEFGVLIAGGDTNAWDGPFVISVTIIGEATERGPVTRSGALPGDSVFVTGDLGGSLSGRHLTFRPRVDEALRLHEAVDLHSMIDLSDGLASDLHHILDESRVGVVVGSESIPVSEAARCATDGRSPLEHALCDGEDFELCFTVSPADGELLLQNSPIETRLSRIGTITSEGICELVDAQGNPKPLPRSGWQHRW